MDCEKFDLVLIDALYDELDELTLAAAKRHADACPRCQSAWTGLRATRKIGVLPLIEAPATLEPAIMQAAREAHGNVPWPKRMGRAISWAGSYAMRPQTAMAAILLLMLGSSVIFVRVKPNRSGAPSRVSVTERGVPEQAAEEMRPEKIGIPHERSVALGRTSRRDEENAPGGPFAAAPAPAREVAPGDGISEGRAAKGAGKAEPMSEPLPPPRSRSAQGAADDLASNTAAERAAGASADKKKDEAPRGAGALGGGYASPPPRDAYAAAMELYSAGRYSEAEKAFDDVAAGGGKNGASAALYAAKSAESAYGCSKAATKYEAVQARYAGTSPGAEALWGAANCYKLIGSFETAKSLYIDLRSVAGYRDRAEAELENLKILQQQQMAARANRAQAPAKPAATAAPASPPAAPKNTDRVGQ